MNKARARKRSDAAFARTIEGHRIQFEKKWYLVVGDVLQYAGEQCAQTYLRTSNEGTTVRAIQDALSYPMQEVYQDMYQEVGKFFGILALNHFVGSGSKSIEFKADPTDESNPPDPWGIWDPWLNPYMREWMIQHIAERIVGITEATRKKIRTLIIDALQSGEGSVEIAKLIQKDLSFSYERATRIVQTEMTAAQNASQHYALSQFADTSTLTKNWLATNDQRTRATHEAAHLSQRDIPYNEPFLVGGAKLMYPGDTSLGAPAREVIRCRCTTTYRRGVAP